VKFYVGTPVLRQRLKTALRTAEFLAKHGVTVRSFMQSAAEVLRALMDVT
jgi:hypothetical protein